MNFEALVKHISTIQNTLQAQAAHAVNLALTSRNWLMGCYIVEFEQNGEDRAAYGEQLLKKLEQRLKTKGLNERRFREFRRLYLVYPRLKESVTQYIASQIQIRQSLTAESENGVWKLSTEHPQTETWMIPADRLFNRLSSTHLNTISGIENPVKRAFYEMETMRGCWSVKELERQIASLYYERSGLFRNDKILLVKEKNGTWSLPGGWVDISQSIKTNTEKEVKEEAGLNVKATRIIAMQDRNLHNIPPYAYNVCKVFVLCEIESGYFRPNIETDESTYFGLEELPILAKEKNNEKQIKMCFSAYYDRNWQVLFD